MIPPNLKHIVLPNCCGNCNNWCSLGRWCDRFNGVTLYDNVCDDWIREEEILGVCDGL